MNCPNCKSDNTQTLAMIFDAGTTTGTSVSRTHGGGFFNILPTFRAKSKTKSVSQSNLAIKAAPPEKKKIVASILIAIIALLLAFGQISPFNFMFVVFLVIAIVAGYLAYLAMDYNKKTWPGEFEKWQKSWKCHKCGNVWIPQVTE